MADNTTTIRLYKGVPVDSSYDSVYSGSYVNVAALGSEVAVLYNQAYQNPELALTRPSMTVTVAVTMAQAEDVNYIAFQNAPGERIYYGFVLNRQRSSNNAVRLTYALDMWGTYFSSCTLGSCFVRREHVTNDVPGEWGPDESVPVGGFVRGMSDTVGSGGTEFYYLLVNPPKAPEGPLEKFASYNSEYYWFEFWELVNVGTNLTRVTSAYINGLNVPMKIYKASSAAAWNAAVYSNPTTLSTWKASFPQWYTKLIENSPFEDLFDSTYDISFDASIAGCGLGQYVARAFVSELDLGAADTETGKTFLTGWAPNFGTYTPTNMKCHSRNFRSFTIGSFDGQQIEIPFEQVYKDGGISATYGKVNKIGGGKYLRLNYALKDQQIFNNSEYDLPVSSDAGQALARESENSRAVQTVSTALTLAASAIGTAASGGSAAPLAAGATAGALGLGAGAVNAQRQASSAGIRTSMPQLNNATIDLSQNRTGFYFQVFEASPEDIARADSYFTAYGYEVDRYKVPNITGHSPYNYVQTEGARVLGNIPDEARTAIAGILDKGVKIY